ncbi:MAG: TrmH family RNA methyltransferase [Baekduia sp.]
MTRIEGVHAVKHALRFGARIESIMAVDPERAAALFFELAPDVAPRARELLRQVGETELLEDGRPVATGVVAIAATPAPARVPPVRDAPLVVLDRPRSLANTGAVIRVAAAAGAAGVFVTGDSDPWHPAAIRGAAGLHFAIPVGRVGSVGEIGGPVVGFDAGGTPFDPGALPSGAALVFGSERHGLSGEARRRCDEILALPMRAGVSSLNLATSVSAVLLSWRFATGWAGGDPGP